MVAIKELSPEAEEWAAKINACWQRAALTKAEAKTLTKGPTSSQIEAVLVEAPLAKALTDAAHDVRRQVICDAGRIDIFDYTANEIIECKARGSVGLISEAVKQLQHYRCWFPAAQLAIAVPHIEDSAKWVMPALNNLGIRLIEVEKGVGA